MAGLFRGFVRTVNFLGLSALAVTLLASGVCAQTRSTTPSEKGSPQAITATHASDTGASAQPADARINTTEIASRLDRELGFDLQATTTGWQRGSNENTNGLLRQYFPRATDFSRISQSYLNAIALRLNQRPRKTLGFETPADRLQAVLH